MNDIELLKKFRDDVPEPSAQAWGRARGALSAVKQEGLLADHQSVDPARSLRRGHVRPAWRWAGGLGVAGVAAGIALTLTLTGTSGPLQAPQSTGTPRPSHSIGTIRTAGFVLTANTNGTFTLTMKQVLDPAALQHALAERGIPALVKTGTYCTSIPAPPDPTSIGVLQAKLPFKPPRRLVHPTRPVHPAGITANTRTTINPAAIPKGTELIFGYIPGHSLVSAGLIDTNSYTCSSQPATPGPNSK